MADEVKHPAKFNEDILTVMDVFLPKEGIFLDPFAGVGRIHELATGDRQTVGIEIEEEWASAHPDTKWGDSLTLAKMFPENYFDGIATSPTYGNRMADHFEAKDDSKRITYRHTLGRELHENNSGRMQWGKAYRELHSNVYAQCVTVTKPGGCFILNIKDHIRAGERIQVTDWHVDTLDGLGFKPKVFHNVPTQGMRFGENHESRVDHESVIQFILVK